MPDAPVWNLLSAIESLNTLYGVYNNSMVQTELTSSQPASRSVYKSYLIIRVQ